MKKFLRRLTAFGLAFSAVWFSVTGISAAEFKSVSSPKYEISAEEQRKYVTLCGVPFGIRMYTKGVIVVGIEEVETQIGFVSPAKKAGIQKGDSILSINGVETNSNLQVYELFRSSGGQRMNLRVMRDGKEHEADLTPVKDKSDGRYHAGLWVRDSSAGIGILTFYDKNTKAFGGLGHAVCDVDTGETMALKSGDIALATITGCYRGKRGEAGELCGMLGSDSVGTLLVNGNTGVYGVMNSVSQNSKEIPVAAKSEVHVGKVKILTAVEGNLPQYYDAEIIKIYSEKHSDVKNFVVEVTDKDLISKTGGIVQGMSGSPIIQDGRFAGAITHVFINNPLQGYGIYAETMVEKAKEIKK